MLSFLQPQLGDLPLERVALLEQRPQRRIGRSAPRAVRDRSGARNSVAASLPWPPSSSVACSVRMWPSCSYAAFTFGRGVVERFLHRDAAVAVAIGCLGRRAPRRSTRETASRCARRRSWSR